MEVVRRLDPRPGTRLVFSRDGVVLHTLAEQRWTAARHGEVYVGWRAGAAVLVSRAGLDDLDRETLPDPQRW